MYWCVCYLVWKCFEICGFFFTSEKVRQCVCMYTWWAWDNPIQCISNVSNSVLVTQTPFLVWCLISSFSEIGFLATQDSCPNFVLGYLSLFSQENIFGHMWQGWKLAGVYFNTFSCKKIWIFSWDSDTVPDANVEPLTQQCVNECNMRHVTWAFALYRFKFLWIFLRQIPAVYNQGRQPFYHQYMSITWYVTWPFWRGVVNVLV